MQATVLRVLGTLALAVASPLLLLAALEGVAWALGVEPLADSPNRARRDQIRSCRWNPEHVEQCAAPRLGRRRAGRRLVFVIGGSSVVGHPAGETRNIPHYLRERLDRERRGRFAVRSLARPCKDSSYVEGCALRVLDASPDFLVIYSGHNDFSGHTSRWPRLSIWITRHGWPLLRFERWLAGFRFWALLSRAQDAPLLPALDPGFGLSAEERAEMNRTILDHFTANLERVIERARERGTEVVLVTVVSNLHEFPHRRRDWPLVIDRHRRKGDAAGPGLGAFVAGIRAFQAERFEDALRAFEEARDLAPRTRAPALLNARIRELAATHPNVHLVDFEPELSRLGLRDGVGCNFFGTSEYCDGVHVNPPTSERIGEAVAERVLALSPRTPGGRRRQP